VGATCVCVCVCVCVQIRVFATEPQGRVGPVGAISLIYDRGTR